MGKNFVQFIATVLVLLLLEKAGIEALRLNTCRFFGRVLPDCWGRGRGGDDPPQASSIYIYFFLVLHLQTK